MAHINQGDNASTSSSSPLFFSVCGRIFNAMLTSSFAYIAFRVAFDGNWITSVRYTHTLHLAAISVSRFSLPPFSASFSHRHNISQLPEGIRTPFLNTLTLLPTLIWPCSFSFLKFLYVVSTFQQYGFSFQKLFDLRQLVYSDLPTPLCTYEFIRYPIFPRVTALNARPVTAFRNRSISITQYTHSLHVLTVALQIFDPPNFCCQEIIDDITRHIITDLFPE